MKVARVLDRYTVAITGGADIGIKPDDVLLIANDIIDPETGDVIGAIPDLKVRVTGVYPRFCVATTYRGTGWHTVNIGDDVSRVTQL